MSETGSEETKPVDNDGERRPPPPPYSPPEGEGQRSPPPPPPVPDGEEKAPPEPEVPEATFDADPVHVPSADDIDDDPIQLPPDPSATRDRAKTANPSTSVDAGNLYELLGLKQDASQSDVKTAYRQRAMQNHPDKNHSKKAEEMMKLLNQAYSILSDGSKKAAYDAKLEEDGDSAPADISTILPAGPPPADALRTQLREWKGEWAAVVPVAGKRFDERFNTLVGTLRPDWEPVQRAHELKRQCMNCDHLFSSEAELSQHTDVSYADFLTSLAASSRPTPAQVIDEASPFNDISSERAKIVRVSAAVPLARRLCGLLDQSAQEVGGDEYDAEVKDCVNPAWLTAIKQKMGPPPDTSTSGKVSTDIMSRIRYCLERESENGLSKNRTTATSLPLFSGNPELLAAFFVRTRAELPVVTVREAPPWVPDKECPTCTDCGAKFGLFATSRHHCRACGRGCCAKCMIQRPVPQYGFSGPVYVCTNRCAPQLRVEDGQTILKHAQTMAVRNEDACMRFLATAHDVYNADDAKQWRALGTSMMGVPRLLCYQYARLDANSWMELLLQARNDGLFPGYLAMFSATKPTKELWNQLLSDLSKNRAAVSAIVHVLRASGATPEECITQGAMTFAQGQFEFSWACFNAAGTTTDWVKRGDAMVATSAPIELVLQCYRVVDEKVPTFVKLLVLLDQHPDKAYRTSSIMKCVQTVETLFLTDAATRTREWASQSRSELVMSSLRVAWLLLRRSVLSDTAPVWLDNCVASMQLSLSPKVMPTATLVARKCLDRATSAAMQQQFDWNSHAAVCRARPEETAQAVSLFCSRLASKSLDWAALGQEALKKGELSVAASYFGMAGQDATSAAWWAQQAANVAPLLGLKYTLLAWSIQPKAATMISAAQLAMDAHHPSFALHLLSALLRSSLTKVEAANVHLTMASFVPRVGLPAEMALHAFQGAERLLSPDALPEHIQRQKDTIQSALEKQQTEAVALQLQIVQELFTQSEYGLFARIMLGPAFNCDDRSLWPLVDEFLAQQLSLGVLEERSRSDKGVLLLVRGVQHMLRGNYSQGVEDLFAACVTFPNREGIWMPVAAVLSCPRFRTRRMQQELKILDNPYKTMLELPVTSLAEFEHKDKLKASPESRILSYYEKKTREKYTKEKGSTQAAREVALSYRNIATAAQGLNPSVAALLQCAFWFVTDLKAQTTTAEKYASKKAVFEVLTEAYALATRGSIAVRGTVCRLAASLVVQAVHLCTEAAGGQGWASAEELQTEANFGALLVQNYLDCFPFFPVFPQTWSNLRLSLVADARYIGLVQHLLVRDLFIAYQVHPPSTILPTHVLTYQRYEADLMGWCPEGPESDDEDEKGDSDDEGARKPEKPKLGIEKIRQLRAERKRALRAQCVQDMLATQNWDANQVAALLQWPRIPRTPDGFLLRERHQLRIEGEAFASCDGVQFNLVTGDIHLLLRKPQRGEHALFGWADVAAVMSNGIADTFFTLDSPGDKLSYHPFQTMRFGPAELWGTDFLATMFHADYLLKFFTTGTEVSALPPFEMRPVGDGLLERLPTRLREVVQSIPNRRGRTCIGDTHRFWIEAGEIPFDIDKNTPDTHVVFRFGRPHMSVKKELSEKDNVPEAKESAETQFAREFSRYYDDIGEYFPEFLRLRELIKLAGTMRVIHSHTLHLKEAANPRAGERDDLIRQLDTTRRGMKLDVFPRANDYNLVNGILEDTIKTTKSRVQREYGYAAWTSEVESRLRREIKTKIATDLQEADRELLNGYCQQFAEMLGKPGHSLQSEVSSFLSRDSRPLADLIIRHRQAEREKPLLDHARFLQRISFSPPKEIDNFFRPSPDKCGWVPTAIRHEPRAGMLFSVYGGVAMGLSLKNGNVVTTSATLFPLLSAASAPRAVYGTPTTPRRAPPAPLLLQCQVIPQVLTKTPEIAAVLQKGNFALNNPRNVMMLARQEAKASQDETYARHVADKILTIGRETSHLPPAVTQAKISELVSALRAELRHGTPTKKK